MLRKLLLSLGLAASLTFSPLSPVLPAQATNCLSVADSYAAAPDNFGYYNMYQCYKTAGLQTTESSCAKYLQDAISYYRLQFNSSGFSSIIKYDNCRAVLPKTPGSTTSSGSNSSGTSTGVVSPGCTAAPEPPVVKSRNTLTGLVISVSPSQSGQKTDRIAYVVNYYDSLSKKWLGWSSWAFVSGATDLTFTKPTDSQTKIAFDSLSQNPCGNSARTRADVDSKGLAIFNPPADEISQVVTSVTVGVSVSAEQLVSTLTGKPANMTVLTPKTCALINGVLQAKAPGKCSIALTSAGSAELVSKNTTLELTMVAPPKTITCYKTSNKKVTRKVTAVAPKCPSGFTAKR